MELQEQVKRLRPVIRNLLGIWPLWPPLKDLKLQRGVRAPIMRGETRSRVLGATLKRRDAWAVAMRHGHSPLERWCGNGHLVICSSCGAWAQVRIRNLARKCPGAPTEAGRVVLQAIERGKHPRKGSLLE